MSSTLSSGPLKAVLIGSILAVCFAVTFLMYYQPKIEWLTCPTLSDNVKKKICANIERNDTKYTTGGPQPPVIERAPAKTEITEPAMKGPDTIILVWMYPFGSRFDLHSCKSLYNIDNCQLTDDKNLYSKADGVIFHHRDIRGDIANMPKAPRPAHQKWIWMNMESPSNTNRIGALDSLFNLTSNYRRDADMQVPYIKLNAVGQTNTFEIPRKEKLACWVVSNWNPTFKRVQYYNELSKYINIDVYGRHFGRFIDHENFKTLISSCKFYLSFENSIHKDYITEKLYNPLRFGAVPVVLGPPRENYEEILPREAFIHVDDFASAKELADYLMLLDKNEVLYTQYFTWHNYFEPKTSAFGQEHSCRACDYIQRNNGFKIVKNLNRWFWG